MPVAGYEKTTQAKAGLHLDRAAGGNRDYCHSRRLLLPALAKAKAKAQKVNCVSDLKQWGLAQYMYATDNNDTLACDGMGDNGPYMPADCPERHAGRPVAWFNVRDTLYE